jgi:VWFA-related protein
MRALFTLVLTACAGAQQAPVIRVPVRLVTVPTLVLTGDGHILNGLKASDFRLLDDGQARQFALDTEVGPVSLAIAVQSNVDVREYLPYLARTGNLIDALLAGENGETALVAYNDERKILKPFGEGGLSDALRQLSPSGKPAHMLDAAAQAVKMLEQRPASRARILLLAGQPMDSGSETKLDDLRREVQRENISVFALTLPELGKAFVSDSFTLEGLSSRTDRGGFRAGTDLKNLVTVLDRAAAAQAGADPFTVLTSATGGMQIHFRKQKELEGALAAIGAQVRSAYVLSFTPGAREPGYHAVTVEVGVAGAKPYARPGYWVQ